MPDLLRNDLESVLHQTHGLWPELRGQRIFLTGATGFFGCWLLETLLYANRELSLGLRATVLTRDPESFAAKAPHLAGDAALELHQGDVRDFEFPAGEYPYVIHAATESSAKMTAENPSLMFDTIVEGTRRTLAFAREAGCRKFLFLSSGAVYGKQPPSLTHVTEECSTAPDPLDAASAYAEGKRAAELLCALASKASGLEVKVARCFAFVGPYMRLDTHFAIGNFIRDQMLGRSIRVQGDGTALRSYLYASDLAAWLWTILLRGNSLRPYNVGSEEAVSIRELAEAVSTALTPKVGYEVLGRPSGAPPARYVPATERARQELGLRASVTLEEAIRRTQQWAIAQQKATGDSGRS